MNSTNMSSNGTVSNTNGGGNGSGSSGGGNNNGNGSSGSGSNGGSSGSGNNANGNNTDPGSNAGINIATTPGGTIANAVKESGYKIRPIVTQTTPPGEVTATPLPQVKRVNVCV